VWKGKKSQVTVIVIAAPSHASRWPPSLTNVPELFSYFFSFIYFFCFFCCTLLYVFLLSLSRIGLVCLWVCIFTLAQTHTHTDKDSTCIYLHICIFILRLFGHTCLTAFVWTASSSVRSPSFHFLLFSHTHTLTQRDSCT